MTAFSSVSVPCHACGKVLVRNPYRIKRVKYVFCSNACKQSNPDFIKLSAERRGDIQRGRGAGVSYIKQGGRHQHRVVAEATLGRPLLRGEIVHHIDGNRRNNAPENLQVMSQSDHMKLHWPEMRAARKQKAGF